MYEAQPTSDSLTCTLTARATAARAARDSIIHMPASELDLAGAQRTPKAWRLMPRRDQLERSPIGRL